MPGNDSYTKLLLHCNGSAQTFADNSLDNPKTITANGNVTQSADQSKFGGKSALFDGNGDYLSIDDNDDWYFGSGDFTIDFWLRPSSLANVTFFNQYVDSNNKIEFNFLDGNLIRFQVVSGGSATINCGQTWVPSTNTWYHIALVRSGNIFKIFINGSQLGSDYTSSGTVPNLAANLTIGARPANSDLYLNGWLDEYRISKGIARWTSNFTPPTEAYSATYDNSIALAAASSLGISPAGSIYDSGVSLPSQIALGPGSQGDILSSALLSTIAGFDAAGGYTLNAGAAFNAATGLNAALQLLRFGTVSLTAASGLTAEVQTLMERLLFLNAGGQVDPGGHATLDAALSLILSSGLNAGEQVWAPQPVRLKQLALQVAIPDITAVLDARELTAKPQTSRIEVTCDG